MDVVAEQVTLAANVDLIASAASVRLAVSTP
jgi:hypothetical protein